MTLGRCWDELHYGTVLGTLSLFFKLRGCAVLFDTTQTQSCATIKTNNRYNYFKNHLHISDNAPYSPPPPFQILRNLWFSFLLGITAVPREIENGAHANSLFLGGGWGEQIRYIMGDVQVAYLFIFFQIAVTTSKYNIIEQYTFTKKKKKRRRRKIIYTTILASNFIQWSSTWVAREEEKFHKRLHSSSIYCTLILIVFLIK